MGAPGSSSETRFRFDGVADPACDQADVYAIGGVSELVASTVSGYHATIFAYGQTASGKTFTMEGFEYQSDRANRPVANLQTDAAKLGLIPRAIHELFSCAAAAGGAGAHMRVRMSYFQLYKEQIYDLLASSLPADRGPARGPKRGLRLRWAAGREFFVENLSEYEVASPAEALELFRLGVAHKAMAETHMNAASSRSHCVLHVDSLDGPHGSTLASGTLSLVDLAGSERQPKGVEKSANMVDSVEINRSLFALRKVIVALSEARRHPHVPYRDSVLTKVLKGSLGGSARTLMVACISIADEAADESLSTLSYAARARAITNVPRVNADPKLSEIRLLREELSSLRAEVVRLTALLSDNDEADQAAAPFGSFGALLAPTACAAAPGNSGGGAGGHVPVPQLRADSGKGSGMAGSGMVGSGMAADGMVGVHPATHQRLSEKLLEAVGALRAALATSARLRETVDAVNAQSERATRAHAELMSENAEQVERLGMLEAVVLMESYPDATGFAGGYALMDAGDAGAGQRDALRRAVQQLVLLRAENAQLRDWEATGAQTGGHAGTPAGTLAGGHPPREAGAGAVSRPGTAGAGGGGAGVHRLSSSGRLVAQHALLLRAEQVRNFEVAEQPADAAPPPPPGNLEGLEQLTVLLRQRASLTRHTAVIASLAKQRSGGPAAGGNDGPLPPARVAFAGLAAARPALAAMWAAVPPSARPLAVRKQRSSDAADGRNDGERAAVVLTIAVTQREGQQSAVGYEAGCAFDQ
ncbi:P-loop containing nucleoside triphosphate hydrolase protein [Pavlovales sp. CCMP2436]|nr:P-loop containing nucleoside triphosphate hydrolase protein [Pavlovales sp. CCMP2436]